MKQSVNTKGRNLSLVTGHTGDWAVALLVWGSRLLGTENREKERKRAKKNETITSERRFEYAGVATVDGSDLAR